MKQKDLLSCKEILALILLFMILSMVMSSITGKARAEETNDPAFDALMEEAEKYLGYPYVYGGSNPQTSFDCSGFVCWVFNESGVCQVGRKGANGLKKICAYVAPGDAKPGDLIFFQNTMGPDVEGITHVGIFVGNDTMIHCGDPIGFVDLSDLKWAKRFHSFGRLPTEGSPVH